MKKLSILCLSVIMVVLSLVAPASAAATADPAALPMSYIGELRLTSTYVNDDDSVTVCATYGLSAAQKIAALANVLSPVGQIEHEVRMLEYHNNPDVARYEAVFSGRGSLDSYFDYGSDARRALGVVPYDDAVELLTIVSKTEDYRSNPDVQYIVDSYLNQTLSGNQLRWGLKVLAGHAGSEYDAVIDEMSVRELIAFAHDVAETAEFQALMAPLSEIRSGNADAYALSCRYTPEELDVLWAKLARAARVYLPGQVQMLEDMTFTVPVAVCPPLENSEAYPQPSDGYGTSSGWAEACS